MSVYVVGDLQGCLAPLQTLLAKVKFDANKDELWLAGDLVNRGPDSLGCLRFVKSLGDSATVVLGNHDLHLLAMAEGARAIKKKDNCSEVLDSPDANELLDWLIKQPLLQHSKKHNLVMTHAGLPHIWSLKQAKALAKEVSKAIVNKQTRSDFFANMYGNEPANWQDALTGSERLRTITNYFTRMRFITEQGELDFAAKEGLSDRPEGFFPWFELQPKLDYTLVFGHWAALMGQTNRNDILGLDTGFVWGNQLTLLELESRTRWLCHAEDLSVTTL